MEDDDNIALAVRALCKRDPTIVFWEDGAEVMGIGRANAH